MESKKHNKPVSIKKTFADLTILFEKFLKWGCKRKTMPLVSNRESQLLIVGAEMPVVLARVA